MPVSYTHLDVYKRQVLTCLVQEHKIESRAGLIYGPFSPVYGAGAVALTVGLSWAKDKSCLLYTSYTGTLDLPAAVRELDCLGYTGGGPSMLKSAPMSCWRRKLNGNLCAIST